MERNVVHYDLDSFFVSVECLLNPKLIGKPILIGGTGDRGVVASCSYEARRFGVHSAMPVKMAKRLCPDAIIIRGDHEQYSKYSRMVTEIIQENVPLYEKASIDEFYIDLSGMERFFGSWKLAVELRQKIIRETGLPISFGLSQNKTVSKIATGEAKPNGQKQVVRGTERPFLAPLSVKKIPMVGNKTYELLRGMGVEKVQTLQRMPPEMLEAAMGKHGILIWERANGMDNSPVVPYSERKSISTEQTFQDDTIDVDFLRRTLVRMAQEVGFSLRKENKLCGCITLKLRYSNFDTYTKQIMIPYTSLDNILIDKAKELFEKLYERRMLVRLIGLRVSHLVQGNYQIDLFQDTQEMISLYQAIDKMNMKYGELMVRRAG